MTAAATGVNGQNLLAGDGGCIRPDTQWYGPTSDDRLEFSVPRERQHPNDCLQRAGKCRRLEW
jgi:hypothetical protein